MLPSHRHSSAKPSWTIFRADTLPEDWWGRWDELNAAGCDSHPLLQARFAKTLLAHFGVGELRFAALLQGDDVVTQMILQQVSRTRWEVFQPSQGPMPMIVYRSPDTEFPQKCAALLPRLARTALVLDLPSQDLPFSALGTLDSSLLQSNVYGTTTAIQSPKGFNDYWQGRPKGLRKNISRYFRRLERDGLIFSLHVVTNAAEMPDAVARYGVLESSGWKGKEGSSVHPGNAQGRFYTDLMSRFATDDCARAYFLCFGDRLAAARLVIQNHNMVVILKTTYDESLSQYAPGRLQLHLVLQNILKEPSPARIEFYTKANADAVEWATSTRDMHSVTAFRSVALAAASRALRTAYQRSST